MNAPDHLFLPDVQSGDDRRDIAIQRVGVKSLTHPVLVKTARGSQPSVASFDMYVGLPADQKGTHMSRFVDVLQSHAEPLSLDSMQQLVRKMTERLDAGEGYIEVRLPFFVTKTAPVSGVESLMDYQLTFRVDADAQTSRFTQRVVVPVTSLCPCSKKVSDYGAHNQRAHITITAELAAEIPVEDQIRIAEDASSCEIWGLLKRPDEKYVTERAYNNPKFVEDVVRDVALALNTDPRIVAYTVEAENFESIHNHSAYALITHDKRRAQGLHQQRAAEAGRTNR
ncbi:MAG TPA: GTP cyclohydrolase FolE2 [Burkholderiaceae bacterium]|nr:GTP cyclohydrolase FolE2 [Burkholderiaceae bacterium]